MYIHLTTVHSRADTRIMLKEMRSLSCAFRQQGCLIVADGLGSSTDLSGIPIVDIGRLPGGRIRRATLGSLRALRAVRSIDARIVHFHDPELILLGFVLKAIGYRVIYDVHEDVPRQILTKHWIPASTRRVVGRAVEAIELLAGHAFDGIVAATPVIAERFPANKRVVVENYPLESEFPEANPRSAIQRPPDFAYIGGIAEVRGARVMLDAVEQLRDVRNLRLHLAGRMDQHGLLSTLREHPAWNASVVFHGFLERPAVVELLGHVRAGLLLLQPMQNYQDSLPIKMFEYMAAGIPVIASDFPGWRGIIEDAGCGILVDPLDTSAVTRAMRWVLNNPEQADAMGRRGQMAVAQRYNWRTSSQALFGLYERLGLQSRWDRRQCQRS